jgi:hypothetical protein
MRYTTTIVIAVIGYLLLCAWVWPFTMDDSFISFRYAKHIGDGVGPVWNLADRANPIEGFTSFLYVWLLGGLRFVAGVDVEVAGKIIGVLSGLALAVIIGRTTHRLGLRGIAVAVAMSVMVLPFMALNSVSGMETTLFMLWNFLCAITCLRALESPTRGGAWLFVASGLLGTLTRPEFAPAFLLMSGYLWWQRPAIRPTLVQALAVCYVLPGVLVTAWRYSYYGQLVPYPFYAKQSAGLSGQGILYVIRFLWLLVLPYALILATGWRPVWNSHRHLLAILGLNLGFACLYFSTAKPMMGWWFRFLLPQVPLLALTAAAAWHARPTSLPSVRRWRVAAASLLLATNLVYVPVIIRFTEFHLLNEERYREVGRRLRPLAADDRWLLFYDVGSVVYEAEWNTLDEVSLNTDRRHRGSPCVTRTDVILRRSQFAGETPNPCPELYDRLVRLPFVRQHPIVESYMDVYVRKDLHYAAELRRSLVEGWPDQTVRPTNWVSRFTVGVKPFEGVFPHP